MVRKTKKTTMMLDYLSNSNWLALLGYKYVDQYCTASCPGIDITCHVPELVETLNSNLHGNCHTKIIHKSVQ